MKLEPGKIFLNQIELPEAGIANSEKVISEISEDMEKRGFNLVFPMVYPSEKDEDKFILATGIAIYEAAQKANLSQIWVFPISKETEKSLDIADRFASQAKANTQIISNKQVESFIDFVNESAKGDLMRIKGVGSKYAEKIINERPYKDQEDLRRKLGAKQSFNWLNAYTKIEKR